MPVTLRNGTLAVNTYAFLGPGSSLTLLEENIAKKLGDCDPLKLKWTSNIENLDLKSRRVKFNVIGSNNVEHFIDDARTLMSLNLPLQTMNGERLKKEYPYLSSIPLKSFADVRPTLLIGLNYSQLILLLDRKTGLDNQPIGIKTKLGWLVFGNENVLSDDPERVMIMQKEESVVFGFATVTRTQLI